MAGMKWYKVWLVVPGTDFNAEGWPCEPEWWNDMEQAPDEETAIRQANEKARSSFSTRSMPATSGGRNATWRTPSPRQR